MAKLRSLGDSKIDLWRLLYSPCLAAAQPGCPSFRVQLHVLSEGCRLGHILAIVPQGSSN